MKSGINIKGSRVNRLLLVSFLFTFLFISVFYRVIPEKNLVKTQNEQLITEADKSGRTIIHFDFVEQNIVPCCLTQVYETGYFNCISNLIFISQNRNTDSFSLFNPAFFKLFLSNYI